MTEFRKQYDARLADINSAIETMPGSLDQYLPGFNKPGLKRFFKRFSLLLGRVDKAGAKHPQYLWWAGQQLTEALQAQVDQAIPNMANGAGSFVATNLHQLILLQERLEKAVGTDLDELKGLAPAVAADLSTSVQQAEELLSRIRDRVGRAEEGQLAIESARKSSEDAQASAKDAAERAGEARRALDDLLNPDARYKSSLESLARRARERVAEVDNARSVIKTSVDDAANLIDAMNALKDAADGVIAELADIKLQAEQVLNLSSQAGLAASYKKEEQSLGAKSHVFTAILYTVAAITIIIAAFYVLPGLQTALSMDHIASATPALVAALLRATVLAPLVYVIYFTTRRISSLETLRMDYAEKAAASLAYSGYRDQMTSDDDLLRQLKGSLLSKFHDHPERLLRPGAMSSSARVKTPGFEAETRINMPEDASDTASRSKESNVAAGDGAF